MGFSIFPKDTLICGLKELGINPSKSKFQLVDDLNHKLLTANIKKDLTQWKNLHIINYLKP